MKLLPSWHLQAVESISLIRVVAVFLIVSGHFNYLNYGGGGAYTLMLLAGITYARYILPRLDDLAQARRMHRLLIFKIALPSVLLILVSQLLFKDHIDWRPVLLVSSYFEPLPISYWFIEIYIQINLLFLLLTWLPGSVGWLERLKSFLSASVLLLAMGGLAAVSGMFWPTENLLNRVPNQLLWIFAAGIVYAAAGTPRLRLAFVALFLLAAQCLWGLAKTPVFFIAATVLMAAIPLVKLPALGARLIDAVARASLMIYLTQFQLVSLWNKFFPDRASILSVMVVIMLGVIIQILYDAVWRRLRNGLMRTQGR